MTWHTLYRTSDGALLGHGTSIPDPFPAGVSQIVDAERQDQDKVWNPSTLNWDAKSAQTAFTIAEFMQRLTLAERLAYYANHSNNVQTVKDGLQGVRDMNQKVDVTDPVTGTMLELLVAEGVITSERKTEILEP